MNGAPQPPVRASIIIASYNRRADLEACLASLPWPELEAHAVEVIVVDDGSADGTSAMVQERFAAVHTIVNESNRGLAQAHNQGTAAARGRLIINIDSDVLVLPGWLEAYLDADDGATVLGGRVIDFYTGEDQGGPRRSTFLGKSLRCAPARANVATGCNMAFPLTIFDAIGGFDEDLPYYFEDRDFCIRAGRAGFGFRYLAGAAVRHKGRASARGEAIRLQERHSVYAMLKAYRGRPLHLAAFTAANGGWLLFRLAAWGAAGRFADCARLAGGWWSAYRRFLRRADHY